MRGGDSSHHMLAALLHKTDCRVGKICVTLLIAFVCAHSLLKGLSCLHEGARDGQCTL